jgi:hypothetical protein
MLSKQAMREREGLTQVTRVARRSSTLLAAQQMHDQPDRQASELDVMI